MTHQSKSYKKFVASAATATLVASALVPAASAATPAFTDVSKDYQEAVDYIVEHGFAQGTTDTTFGTAQNISRGDAAVMIANALNLDTANAEDAGFQDVNNRVAPSVNAIVEAGIASGRTSSKFDPAAYITRQEMAKMLANAYELEAETKAGFTDVNNNWIDYVSALKEAGITLGKTETTFAPEQNLTRGEFALFMFRAETMEVVLELKSATATDANTLSVTLSDDSAHTVTLDKALEANVATEVTFEIDGNEYTATVTWVVTNAEVVSVSAINAKQLLVTFNSAVGTNATDVSSYGVSTITGALTNEVLGAAVQADGKSVLLTLEDAYRVSTDLAVAVDGVYVKDSIKDTFPRFATTVTVNDSVAPSIVSATAKTNTDEAQSVSISLSEPITNDAIFKVNGKTVSAAAVTTIDYTTAGVAVETVATDYILSGIELETGKTHTVEIINAEDYAENKAEDILSKTFTVTKDNVVATGKVVAVQDNKIKVTFDKAVNEASLSNVAFFTYDATTAVYTNEVVTGPVQADKAGKEWIFELDNAAGFYGTNDSTEDVLVKVQAGVVDTAGNAVKPFDATVELTQDVTGPTLEGITFDKNSKGEVTKLYFAFDELLADTVPATILDTQVTVKNTANNQVESFNTLFGAVTAELAADGKTVVATVVDPAATPVTKGSYTFEVQSGANALVTDAAVANNNNRVVAKTVSFGVVSNQITVDSITNTNVAADDQTITVTFEKPVTATSAKNPANYIFAGKTLPAGTEIVVATDGLTATFDLPRDYIAETDTDATIVVQNIKPVDASETFKKYADVIPVTDNTRPGITPSILNTGAIKLTFSETVTTAGTPASDISKVLINGLELASYTVASETDINTGNQVVIIEVAADEVQDFNGTGFSYQYIDVDGVVGFNPATDIELRKATGNIPASWALDNGIAKLNLSVITSVEVVTSATPSDITDADGNAIKPNTTIKAK